MTAARGNAHAPSRRRRWPLLLGAVAAAAAGLLLLLFVAPRLIPSGWLIPRLEQLLSRALGTPVQVASAQATSFLPLTIVVENVTLGQQRPDARLTGTIRQGEFGIGWLNLFRRRPTFTHLHLVEADLQLPTSTAAGPSGQWRPSPAPAAPHPAAPHLAAPHLAASLSAPSHRVFHHLGLTLRLAADDTPTDTNAELFTIEQLTVQNSRLSWPDTPFRFERLNTEGRVQGREVTLRQTTADWLNGTLEASAVRLTFAPERLGFAITGRLTDIATETLASPPETAAVTGQGTFRLDIAGQYRYETRNFEGLSGSGDGDLRDGHFPRFRPGAIGRTLAPTALPMRLGNFDLGPVQERLLGTDSELPSTSEGLSFRELVFRFALEGTTVRLDGLTCTLAEDRQIFGQGAISLAERPAQINFDLRFPLNFVTGRSASRLPFFGTLSERQMIPVRVTGTFERPVVEIISLSL